MNIVELLPAYTRDTLFPDTPRDAVHKIVRLNLRSEQHRTCSARGKGNKASRREARVRSLTDTERQLREIFSGLTGMGLTASDVDRMAEQWTESRTLKPRRNLAHP